ncbi:SDR family oxidoreductase [Chelativorans sp. Marseille-P2723]|uniref:SDR family NAD(P)-dependent oxidoreductase n=1 Tax=Chelativorans sp. Marseille-P2723 TaxID=2709133 RepID=UPI0015714044|nr:SDR family oxidoreductase [Chelativorans sp. Marseille-P2723]
MSAPDDPNRQVFAEGRGQAPGRGRLEGRRVLVVGGGQQAIDEADAPVGNGRAICELAAREGALLGCVDISETAAEEVCASIVSKGGKAIPIQADVSDPDAVTRSMAEFVSRAGGIDGLVLNVGITSGLPLSQITVERWDKDFAVNLRSHMLYAQKGLEVMDDGGSIVFISSLAAYRVVVNQPAYEVSKAGILTLSRSVAKAGEPRGIRSNCVLPGLIDTPLGRLEGRRRADRARAVPFGRQGTGWEVAYPVIFLLSHEASYVNAQEFAVDGGYHAGIVRA